MPQCETLLEGSPQRVATAASRQVWPAVVHPPTPGVPELDIWELKRDFGTLPPTRKL